MDDMTRRQATSHARLLTGTGVNGRRGPMTRQQDRRRRRHDDDDDDDDNDQTDLELPSVAQHAATHARCGDTW